MHSYLFPLTLVLINAAYHMRASFQEQYIFIHDAILEACLCGETAIPMSEFAVAYKELLRVDSQSNSSPLREEFQVRSVLDASIMAVSLSIIQFRDAAL